MSKQLSKNELKQAKEISRHILSQVVDYQSLFLRINDMAEDENISPAVRLKADSMLVNEYQFLRTSELKAPLEKADLNDLSDDELDALLIEAEEESSDSTIIEVEVE